MMYLHPLAWELLLATSQVLQCERFSAEGPPMLLYDREKLLDAWRTSKWAPRPQQN